MLTSILLIVAGIILLYLGGEFLVRGAGSLALRLGLPPMVAGLTVVGFATSTPELVASVQAVLANQGDIAVGNVIGSNTFNVAVILGLTALICPLKIGSQAIRFDAPLMLGVVILPVWVLYDRLVTRVEGGGLFMLIIFYTVAVIRRAKRSPEDPQVLAEYEHGLPKVLKHAAFDVVFIVSGIVLLIFGSKWLIYGSVTIAKAYGISEAFIALTVIAAGTSTPELAASLVAAFRKQPDIAVGNLIGSNVFNVLCILGVAGLIRPTAAPGVAMLDVAVMITFAAALIPMFRSGGTLDRTEGVSLLLGYAVYLFWLWPK